MNFFRGLGLTIISVLVFQCGSKESSKAQNECDAPVPVAIFEKGNKQIKQHSFSLDGHNAKENIDFVDGSELVVFQSGCDKISQEFRFEMELQKEVDAPSLGIERLMFLANLEDKYMSFANWAQAVDGLRQEFATQSNVEVEPGFFVGLDKIDSTERTIMVIRLFQK